MDDSAAAPAPIMTHAPAPSALSVWLHRAVWAASGAVAWTVLVLSAWLQPDGRGFGTHQQLGLPPCTFEALTHVPCPGCGLTTSFAHMAHGHVLQSFGAHLMGPLLFLLTLAVALAAPWAVRRGFPVTRVLEHRATAAALAATLAAGMVTFAIRLVHTLGG